MSGNELFTWYDAERDAWEKAMRQHGHEPEMFYDGKVDLFAYIEHIHNGPVCVRCGWSTCMHCNSDMIIPECGQ